MNTILVVFRHVNKEKATLPVDLHRPKTSLLKLSQSYSYLRGYAVRYNSPLCVFFPHSKHSGLQVFLIMNSFNKENINNKWLLPSQILSAFRFKITSFAVKKYLILLQGICTEICLSTKKKRTKSRKKTVALTKLTNRLYKLISFLFFIGVLICTTNDAHFSFNYCRHYTTYIFRSKIISC